MLTAFDFAPPGFVVHYHLTWPQWLPQSYDLAPSPAANFWLHRGRSGGRAGSSVMADEAVGLWSSFRMSLVISTLAVSTPVPEVVNFAGALPGAKPRQCPRMVPTYWIIAHL